MKQEGEVKSNYHTFRELKSDLQNPHSDPQPTITLISGRPKPSTDVIRHQKDRQMYAYIHVGNIFMHK